MADMKESHHFYPVLLYFRFPAAHYAISFTAGMALDLVSLLESAIDEDAYAWLQESGAVLELWEVSLLLLEMAENTWQVKAAGESSAEQQWHREQWRRRYSDVLRQFRDAGIRVAADPDEGAERYAELRAQWDGRVQALAQCMRYAPAEVDPAHTTDGRGPRRPFPPRLRSAHLRD
jgi:hypothetical protein